MKYFKKFGIVFIFLILLISGASSLVFWLEEDTVADCLSVRVECAGEEEVISCWENKQRNCFFFFPSYANLNSAQILVNSQSPVYLNGNKLENEMDCRGIELNVPYTLTFDTWMGIRETTLTFLQSTRVATMFVDTQSGSMDYIYAKKGNQESGTMRLYCADGSIDYHGELSSIKGRGNATWVQYEKKPYNIMLRHDSRLIGMDAASKWVLLANAADHTNLRNKLVYDTAAETGLEYCPNSEWVDLYINGEYSGLYLLCEANEIHPNRINIGSENTFLVSLETESNMISQNLPYIKTESGQCIRIRESSFSNEELRTIWQSIENALMADDGRDPISGKHYSEMINVDLLARKYILEEIFGNLDAFRASCFFYMDETGMVCAGPVWDYDKAIGNETDERYYISNPDVFIVNRVEDWAGMGGQWIQKLSQTESFKKIYTDLFINEIYPYLQKNLDLRIREYTVYLEDAHKLNWERWYGSKPYQPLSEIVIEIKDYIFNHAAFLQSCWVENEEYCTVSFLNGINNCYFSIAPGELLESVPIVQDQSSEKFLGWYYKDSNQFFDSSVPICEDTIVYAKWQRGPSGLAKEVIKFIPVPMMVVIMLVLLFVNQKRISCDGSNNRTINFKR